MAGLFETAALQLRVAKRLAPRRGASLGERLGRIWIGAGCRDAGRSYRTGRVEDMPKLTAALRRQIGAEIHDHNLRRLSLIERTAADDPARAAVGRLEELLMPVERALSAI